MTTYEYIVRKRDEEEHRSSDKDLKQETPASKPVKVLRLFVYVRMCRLLSRQEYFIFFSHSSFISASSLLIVVFCFQV